MTEMKQKTAWMWLSGQDLRGLSWDRDDDTLTWIWQAGCHCADEDEILQTREEFLRDGAPPLIGTLPRDIVDEVEATLGK
jgi:hypothetical protein